MKKKLKRFNIKEILNDPVKRRDLMARSIIFTQATAGIKTTLEQAYAAYDKIQKEKAAPKKATKKEKKWLKNSTR